MIVELSGQSPLDFSRPTLQTPASLRNNLPREGIWNIASVISPNGEILVRLNRRQARGIYARSRRNEGRQLAIHESPRLGGRICEHGQKSPVSPGRKRRPRDGAENTRIRGSRIDCPKATGRSRVLVSSPLSGVSRPLRFIPWTRERARVRLSLAFRAKERQRARVKRIRSSVITR